MLSQFGFGAITRDAAGQYSLPLAGTPPADNNVIPAVTIKSVQAVSVPLAFVVTGVVHVRTVPGANVVTGVTADSPFYIIVVDDT